MISISLTRLAAIQKPYRKRKSGKHTRKSGFPKVYGKLTKNSLLRIFQLIVLILSLSLVISGCTVISTISTKDFTQSITIQDPDLTSLNDGTYKGTYKIVLPPGVFAIFREITVNVHIASQRYEQIDIEPHIVADDPEWIKFVQRIIEKQSIDVDGVSGATYSTTAMKKAIEKAVSGSNNS